MGKKCNINKLHTNINELSIFLSCLYYESFTINENTIKECYSKNPIKNALDMVNYLQTNIPIRPLHTGIVDVYCFDSLSKSMTIKKLDTSTYKPGKKWTSWVGVIAKNSVLDVHRASKESLFVHIDSDIRVNEFKPLQIAEQFLEAL